MADALLSAVMEYHCIGVFFLMVIGWFVGLHEQGKQLEKAQQAYRASLENLKSDPTNAELRQTTLSLGRAYSNFSRNRDGVTVYDEVALKNDIDAACAGAVIVQTRSVEERLEKLRQLFAAGHI